MNIDYDALETLHTIVEEGSFAAAAERLHRVRSALTHTIKKLELQVGFEVFDRSGHKAVLTPMGRYLVSESEHLFTQMQALKEKVTLKKTIGRLSLP